MCEHVNIPRIFARRYGWRLSVATKLLMPDLATWQQHCLYILTYLPSLRWLSLRLEVLLKAINLDLIKYKYCKYGHSSAAPTVIRDFLTSHNDISSPHNFYLFAPQYLHKVNRHTDSDIFVSSLPEVHLDKICLVHTSPPKKRWQGLSQQGVRLSFWHPGPQKYLFDLFFRWGGLDTLSSWNPILDTLSWKSWLRSWTAPSIGGIWWKKWRHGTADYKFLTACMFTIKIVSKS